jgi:hypothetical protein
MIVKFQIQLKDPDGIDESIFHAARKEIPEPGALFQKRVSELTAIANRWIDGEYLTIEIDTEKNTCEVVGKSSAVNEVLSARAKEAREEILSHGSSSSCPISVGELMKDRAALSAKLTELVEDFCVKYGLPISCVDVKLQRYAAIISKTTAYVQVNL